MKLILASASPRRRALMGVLGLDFTVQVSDCDEQMDTQQPITQLVTGLALQKAQAVAAAVPEPAVVLGADTVVACGQQVLGKPKDAADARRMLHMLSGRTHSVYTGFALVRTADGKTITDCEESRVTFKTLTDSEIDAYIAAGEPMDKAGAYSIQGTASSFVRRLDGDYNNVVGLPLYKLSKYLYQLIEEEL